MKWKKLKATAKINEDETALRISIYFTKNGEEMNASQEIDISVL